MSKLNKQRAMEGRYISRGQHKGKPVVTVKHEPTDREIIANYWDEHIKAATDGLFLIFMPPECLKSLRKKYSHRHDEVEKTYSGNNRVQLYIDLKQLYLELYDLENSKLSKALA